MRLVTAAMLSAIAVPLGACGLADSNATFIPESLRYRPADVQPEIIPDVKALLRENNGQFFATRVPPQNVRVSIPRRNPTGPGWTACVRAEIAGVTGRSIGTQTYLLSIDNGKIGNRRLADATSPCASETYEPV